MMASRLSAIARAGRFAGALAAGGPNYLILFVTGRCNLACPACFYWRETGGAIPRNELTLEEYERISRQLPRLVQVTCGGGEPILRDDLDRIIVAFHRNSGVGFITLNTNGTLPHRTADVVRRVAADCPRAVVRVVLSLDGIGKVHDEARGRAGAWETAMETHELLARIARGSRNVLLQVNSVMTRSNQDGIPALIRFVREELGVGNHSILYPRGAVRDEDGGLPPSLDNYRRSLVLAEGCPGPGRESLALSRRALRSLRRAIGGAVLEILSTGRMPFRCQAGNRLIEISEYGEIFPCETLDGLIASGATRALAPFERCSFGNVRDFDYDVRRAMGSARAREVAAFIRGRGCACTFECALGASLLYNPLAWIRRGIGRDHGRNR